MSRVGRQYGRRGRGRLFRWSFQGGSIVATGQRGPQGTLGRIDFVVDLKDGALDHRAVIDQVIQAQRANDFVRAGAAVLRDPDVDFQLV